MQQMGRTEYVINKGFLRKMTEQQEKESKEMQKRPFTGDELDDAIKLTKKGKAPGPDGIRRELIKWLSKDNRKWLLNTINGWWKQKKAPEELYFAKVASIYKKGGTDKACNYRPISLPSSIYKVYMIMIRTRIQTAGESEVSKT